MSDIQTLSQLRICVEKSLTTENYIYESLEELQQKGFGQLKAAFLKSKIWPTNSTINISFLNYPSDKIKWTTLETLRSTGATLDPLEIPLRNLNNPIEAIKTVIDKRIKLLVDNKLNINIVERDGDVRIGFDPNGGCWSLLGKDHLNEEKNKSTMNFGWLDVGTIIHEFGHMLGLIHEHQNPIGKKIPWNEEKVYQWAKIVQGWDKKTTYTNIIQRYDISQLNGSDFDPNSVMLYFFPGDLTLNGIGTNANYRLSYYDVQYILKVYNKEEDLEKFLHIIYANNKDYESVIKQWKSIKPYYISSPVPIMYFVIFLLLLIGLLLFIILKK